MTLPLHGKQRSWQVVITQKNMAKLPGTDEATQHKRANEENLILDCFFFLITCRYCGAGVLQEVFLGEHSRRVFLGEGFVPFSYISPHVWIIKGSEM